MRGVRLMRAYLSRSWIHPALVGRPSRIHGEGVFATAPVARNEKLMEFGGEKISAADLESGLWRECSVWLVCEGLYLALPENDPKPSLDENLNHSCDPNAWLVDEVTLAARRDIAAGEEITLDQGTWNFDDDAYTWDDADCGCNARDCRKRLTENDWRLPVLQARYRGHFHPAVQRMINLAASKPLPAGPVA